MQFCLFYLEIESENGKTLLLWFDDCKCKRHGGWRLKFIVIIFCILKNDDSNNVICSSDFFFFY